MISNIFCCINEERKTTYQLNQLTKKIIYFENGTINKIFYLTNNNELYGEYIEFKVNGKLWVHCFYKNDRLVGIYKQYYESGKLYHHYNYDTLTYLPL